MWDRVRKPKEEVKKKEEEVGEEEEETDCWHRVSKLCVIIS